MLSLMKIKVNVTEPKPVNMDSDFRRAANHEIGNKT